METKDLVTDFLEVEAHLRAEGRYEFFAHEVSALKEIPDICYLKVFRNPTEFHKGIVEIIFKEKRVTEVFSINKVNIPTYVSRTFKNNQTFEASLELALHDPGQSIVLYGSSKLGKTALWRSIISEESILIQCNSSQNISDIYNYIVDHLGVPHISESLTGSEESKNGSMEGNVSIGTEQTGQMGVTLKKGSSKLKKTEIRNRYIDKPLTAQYVCSLLMDYNIPIVFENFHRLKDSTLKKLAIDLRTFSDEQINVIFVGIPVDPFTLVKYNDELLGRILFMEFKFWSNDDLKKIALGGQEILNVGFNSNTLSFLAKESVGCPLLMQLFSLIGCYASNVIERQIFLAEVKIDDSQFLKAMRNYGNLFLAPCRDAWDLVINKNKKMKPSNENFIKELLSFIKSDKFKLECSFSEIFNETTVNYVKKIIKSLNSNLMTTDFLVFNPNEDTISFGKPLILVYTRWMLD